MGDLGLRGVRRAKSPRTTRSAPKDQCPADLVRRHFEAFALGGLWVADIPPLRGRYPSYVRAFSGWVYVAFVTDVFSRRIIGWQNHLPASVHRPGPGRPSDGRLATKANRGRPDGPGAPLATAARKYRSIRYGQALSECEAVASVGSRATPFGFALAEALKLLVQGRADPQPGPLGGHRRRPSSPPPSGSTGRAPPDHTPPSGCEPPPSTKPPGHPTATTTNNHNRQPPPPDKPATTKPGA